MLKPSIPVIYADSCFFIAVFNREKDRIQTCIDVINAAKGGSIRLVTSFLTVAECSQNSAGIYPAEGNQDQVAAFFDNDFIEKVNVDWFVANEARKIQARVASRCSVKPQDSIHLATAVLEEVNTMFTYDKGLLRLDKHNGVQGLHLTEPNCYWNRYGVPNTGMFATPEDNPKDDEEEDGGNPTRSIII